MSCDQFQKLSLTVGLSALLALSGCHKKAAAPPTPPPPATAAPAPVAPTASITADPNVIDQGQSTTLTWKSSDASQLSISGIGPVSSSGTQSVSPTRSTTYTLTAKGDGGSVEESARVTVNVPIPGVASAEPSMTDEQLFEQRVHDLYFNYDSYALEAQDDRIVDQDAAFLKQHPRMKIVIEGHCDERGSEEYNLALGQSRGEALQQALVTDGIPASRIRVISFGKEKPFCTESNEECWHQNRRDHLRLDQ